MSKTKDGFDFKRFYKIGQKFENSGSHYDVASGFAQRGQISNTRNGQNFCENAKVTKSPL